MSTVGRLMRIALAVLAALQLSACSKTVQWEEEVLLNSGVTLWVKRTDSYVKGGEPGNPLKRTWGLSQRAYEFEWQGMRYFYKTDRKESHAGPIGIYLSSHDKSIRVVDWRAQCAKRGWGEYRWRRDTWEPQQPFDVNFVGQPRNLMEFYSAEEGEIAARMDRARKYKEDTMPNRGTIRMRIEEKDLAAGCSRSK